MSKKTKARAAATSCQPATASGVTVPEDLPELEMPPARGFIVMRKNGMVYVGSGYSQGKAVPYWYLISKCLDQAKVYKTQRGAREAAEKLDGIVAVVEVDTEGRAANWLGYAVKLGNYDRYAIYGQEDRRQWPDAGPVDLSAGPDR